MNLKDLFGGLVEGSSRLDSVIDIKGIALDSRKVRQGFVFLAVDGAKEHGLVYLQQAIENGAMAVVYEQRGSDKFDLGFLDIHLIAINDLSEKLGSIAGRFYYSPSRTLDVIGITGTNGKTTCSQFLLQVLPECGVIGTLGWGLGSQLKKTVNTTPDALAVQEMLADFVKLKAETVVMEVSSHGLQQGRVNKVFFKGAVFTNLSHDHLDYHGSMEEYLQAKLLLFKQPELQFVVINADDKYSKYFFAATDEKVKRWAFSLATNRHNFSEKRAVEYVTVDEINFSLSGIDFFVNWRNERARVRSRIVGDFNLENILTVITVLLAQGYSLNNAAMKVNYLKPVVGRMERFGGDGKPFVFVDYAHTPDALDKILQGLRKYCRKKLWVVFGCGGNRDEGKRFLMGKIAGNLADQIVITNDNPRYENPERIINDILSGCSSKHVEVIKDREQAIRTVIEQADKNDGIVIAGKGHEVYQEINGVKHSFSDQVVVNKALQAWLR